MADWRFCDLPMPLASDAGTRSDSARWHSGRRAGERPSVCRGRCHNLSMAGGDLARHSSLAIGPEAQPLGKCKCTTVMRQITSKKWRARRDSNTGPPA